MGYGHYINVLLIYMGLTQLMSCSSIVHYPSSRRRKSMTRSERKKQLIDILQNYDGTEGIEKASETILDAESAGMQFDPEKMSTVEKWKRETELPEMCSKHCNAEYYVELGNAMRDELQAKIKGLQSRECQYGHMRPCYENERLQAELAREREAREKAEDKYTNKRIYAQNQEMVIKALKKRIEKLEKPISDADLIAQVKPLVKQLITEIQAEKQISESPELVEAREDYKKFMNEYETIGIWRDEAIKSRVYIAELEKALKLNHPETDDR
jgi:hypothetical protein